MGGSVLVLRQDVGDLDQDDDDKNEPEGDDADVQDAAKDQDRALLGGRRELFLHQEGQQRKDAHQGQRAGEGDGTDDRDDCGRDGCNHINLAFISPRLFCSVVGPL